MIKRETICWSPRVVLERVFLCIDKEEDAIESVLGIMQIYSSRLIELPVDINKVLSIVEKNDKEVELYFAFMRVCPMYRTEYLVEQIKNKALRFNNPKYCLEVLFEFNNPYIFDLNGVSNIVIDILSHEKNDNIKMSLIPVNAILKNALNEKKSIFMDFVMVHNDYRTLTSIFLNYEELNICRYRKMDLFKIILNHESSVSSYPRVVDLIPYEDDEKYFKCFLDYINNMENFKEVYIDNTKLFFSDRMGNIYLEKLSSVDIKPGSNAFMLKEAIEKNKMENDKKASRIRNYR